MPGLQQEGDGAGGTPKVLTPGGIRLPAGPAYRVPGLRRGNLGKPLHTPKPS